MLNRYLFNIEATASIKTTILYSNLKLALQLNDLQAIIQYLLADNKPSEAHSPIDHALSIVCMHIDTPNLQLRKVYFRVAAFLLAHNANPNATERGMLGQCHNIDLLHLLLKKGAKFVVDDALRFVLVMVVKNSKTISCFEFDLNLLTIADARKLVLKGNELLNDSSSRYVTIRQKMEKLVYRLLDRVYPGLPAAIRQLLNIANHDLIIKALCANHPVSFDLCEMLNELIELHKQTVLSDATAEQLNFLSEKIELRQKRNVALKMPSIKLSAEEIRKLKDIVDPLYAALASLHGEHKKLKSKSENPSLNLKLQRYTLFNWQDLSAASLKDKTTRVGPMLLCDERRHLEYVKPDAFTSKLNR